MTFVSKFVDEFSFSIFFFELPTLRADFYQFALQSFQFVQAKLVIWLRKNSYKCLPRNGGTKFHFAAGGLGIEPKLPDYESHMFYLRGLKRKGKNLSTLFSYFIFKIETYLILFLYSYYVLMYSCIMSECVGALRSFHSLLDPHEHSSLWVSHEVKLEDTVFPFANWKAAQFW
jgi:hypothetical protein